MSREVSSRHIRRHPKKVESLIAYCGLDCETCPIHLATLEQDLSQQRTMRLEIIRLCSEQYGMTLLPHEVTDCDGCRSQAGRLFSGCAKCEIRACAIHRNLTSCALCADYACERLLSFFDSDPAARKRLEAVRATMYGGTESRQPDDHR